MATKSFIATAFRPSADERRPFRTVYLRRLTDGGLSYSPNRWQATPMTKKEAEGVIASKLGRDLLPGGVQRI